MAAPPMPTKHPALPADTDDRLSFLLERHRAGHAYTTVAPEILLAVGTQQYSHSLPAYDASLAASVSQSSASPTSIATVDHPYSVAERAHRCACTQQASQLIVLTGESGSGKTRTASVIIEYLARRGKEDAASAGLASQLTHANVILSAFGCADLGPGSAQASRLERETTVRFGSDGRAACASVRVFGLEEWRIVRRPATERTFGVFYQLLAGASAQQLRDLQLLHGDFLSSDSFAVTRCSKHKPPPSDDALITALRAADSYLSLLPRELLTHTLASALESGAYAHTMASMAALGFSDEERAQVSVVLAAILLLGNVQFRAVGAYAAAAAADPAQVCSIARLLGLGEESALERALVSYELCLDHGTLTKTFSVQQAEEARDDLARNLYLRLFGWLVRRVNAALAGEVSSAPAAAVCVADLAGFSAQRSSLTQLLYNHASDRLYCALATRFSGALRAQSGRAEAAELCDEGVLGLLDHTSCVVDGTDDSFLRALSTAPDIAASPAFMLSDAASGSFCVQHAGGIGRYVVSEWLRQTQSPLSQDLNSVMTASTLSKELLWTRHSLYFEGDARPYGVPTLVKAFRAAAGTTFAQVARAGAVFVVHCVRLTRDGTAGPIDKAAVREQLDPISQWL